MAAGEGAKATAEDMIAGHNEQDDPAVGAEQYRPGPADWRARWLERVAEYRARLDVADNYGRPCARRVHELAVHAAGCAGFWGGWVAGRRLRVRRVIRLPVVVWDEHDALGRSLDTLDAEWSASTDHTASDTENA